MNITKLRRIKKLYFGYDEIARALGIKTASARVTASRYVRQGIVLRIKRNIYALKEKWYNLAQEELFAIANIAQVPSYVSLASALGYHEISTQIQRGFVESIAVKRTKEITLDGVVFKYVKIKRALYGGFEKKNEFFIACPEKALLDAAYLVLLDRYKIDMRALDFSKLDNARLKRLAKPYPKGVMKILEEHGYTAKA